MSLGLTKKQNAVYQFIVDYITAHHGIAPSYREIAVGIGRNTVSGIQPIIERLVARGLIRKLNHHARSIEVIRDKNADTLELPTDLRKRLTDHCSFYGRKDRDVVVEAITSHLNNVERHIERRQQS